MNNKNQWSANINHRQQLGRLVRGNSNSNIQTYHMKNFKDFIWDKNKRELQRKIEEF